MGGSEIILTLHSFSFGQYISSHGACTIKYYRFVTQEVCSKLLCLFAQASMFDNARRR
jgi:hypothetical protein